MNENKEEVITVMGKEINYGKLSDEKLLMLYEQLKEREVKLYKKITDYQNKYDFLPKAKLNDLG